MKDIFLFFATTKPIDYTSTFCVCTQQWLKSSKMFVWQLCTNRSNIWSVISIKSFE